MHAILAQFFDVDVALKYLPAMLAALLVTLRLAILVVITGLIVGLMLALMRTLQIKPLSLLIVIYADLLRCLPALTLMFLFYFALPLAGVPMSGPVAAWLSLSMVLAAFSEEIYWTAILSVHKGQWEGARSTGLSFAQTIRYVVLPQAMRVAIPPLTNRTIAITKGVALASSIAVPEMLGEAIAATSYSSNSTPLIMAGAGYLAIFLPLAFASRRLEARNDWAIEMETIAQSFLNVAVIERYWPYLLNGLGQTLFLAALAIPLGVVLGAVLGILGTHANKWIRWPISIYVDLLRSFPPLVLLILISTALPHLGLRPPPLAAIIAALLLNSSSYYGEIFRAGLLSVPPGIVSAARATGMSYMQATWYVRLPIATRNVLPDLLSNTLELVKLTSIAAVVTYVELTQAARIVQGLTFNATPIVVAAALYCAVLWPLARLVSRLEQRSLAR